MAIHTIRVVVDIDGSDYFEIYSAFYEGMEGVSGGLGGGDDGGEWGKGYITSNSISLRIFVYMLMKIY